MSRGFTLLEMLTVIAVMAVLAFTALPAISSVLTSSQENQTINSLSGLLEQARQDAVTQNTYVWVGFYQAANSVDLTVAVVESENGTDPGFGIQSYAYGSVPSSTMTLVNKVTTFHQVKLTQAGSITATSTPGISGLPVATPPVSSTNALPTSTLICNYPDPARPRSSAKRWSLVPPAPSSAA